MRWAPWLGLMLALFGCSPRTAAPLQAPAQAPAQGKAAPQSDWRQVEPQQQRQPLVPEPAGVPAPERSCQAYIAHGRQSCGEGVATREALSRALSGSDPVDRDERMSCLEASRDFVPGFVRALRAELAPLACADVLASEFLEPRRAELDRTLEDTLIALTAAGRLARLVQQAPAPPAALDKARFMEFFQGTLKPWIVLQATAIHDLSSVGPRLSPYAKGVVAIEAGLADMRFVAVVRQVPLPKEISADPELREAYYAALDEALEPRKARGRDAALVGLREFANEGILNDPRLERARTLLSEVYSGRRINALDRLLLPVLSPLSDQTNEQRLAARLPTFYAGIVLAQAPLDAGLLRALLERGLPRALNARLTPSELDPLAQDLLVRALLERGRRYVRAADFAESARLSASEPHDPERAFYHALASALQSGPRDASDLLLGGPQPQAGLARTIELDQLAASKNDPYAPLAAFDAAYVLSIAPPQNDLGFWRDLARRFADAARELRDPAQKILAHEWSRAAQDTASALGKNPPALAPRH